MNIYWCYFITVSIKISNVQDVHLLLMIVKAMNDVCEVHSHKIKPGWSPYRYPTNRLGVTLYDSTLSVESSERQKAIDN